MKKSFKLLSIIFMGTLLFQSCNKDDDDDDSSSSPSTSSSKANVTQTWKITGGNFSMSVSGQEFFSGDIVAQMQECDLDNELTFESDNSFVEMEGEKKCNSNDPDIASEGTWSFHDNESKFIMENNRGSTDTSDIETLNSTEFVTTYEEQNGDTVITTKIEMTAQ